MQSKLTILNTLLALFSMALAALSAVIWVQPEYPSRVDPRAVQPAARALESVTLERPTTDRGEVEPIMATNLFRQARQEYVAPAPPPVPGAATAGQAPAAATLPAPDVALRGVFMANGTRVAFLEGKYPVLAGGGQVQEKPLKRKGYYLGDHIGTYKIKSIDKMQVSLSSPQGSIMTVSMPRRLPDQEVHRKGTHLFHKDKDARKNRQVEVEKVIRPAPQPRNQPRGVTPDTPTPSKVTRITPPQRQIPAQAAIPAAPRGVSPPPVITPPRISGAVTPTPAPTPARPHISGAR